MAWTYRSCTAKGRSPGLLLERFCFLPGIPVEILLLLAKYGDEFVQDSHLFPFSPVRSFFPQIILNPSDWHLTQSWLNLLCNLNTVAQIMSILSRSSELKHPLRNSKKPSSDLMSNKGLSYVREKIRTPDLLVRSQTLYPAELRAHIIFLLQLFVYLSNEIKYSASFSICQHIF